ncbi:MAG: hypothetical protein KGJ60_04335 [Verrucomicrobiota bacterium]|nr:hypothetical protein [Verrucomicrobiota bacterium]
MKAKSRFSEPERRQRLKNLLTGVDRIPNALPLSVEDTLNFLGTLFRCKPSQRLQVLAVKAAFSIAKIRPVGDGRGGLVGNVEITLPNGERMVNRCELKNGAVAPVDIDRALQNIAAQGKHVQNYIFITTGPVADEIREYAWSKYDETGGMEIAILDCVGFLRHFLHLFHRLRKDFLDQYQVLVLKEPESAVSQALKEAFLALRQAAESAD